MDDIQILIAFLQGILPDTIAAAVLALVPAILAIVGLARRWIPWFEEHRKQSAPLLALALGLMGGVYVAGLTSEGLLAGVLAALAAVGGHSAAKNVVQQK